MAKDDLINSTGDLLDDFLVSLASGVSTAQKKLLEASKESGSGIMYQIPQLEFELKLQISTSQQARPTGALSRFMPRKRLLVSAPTNQQESAIASTLRGTLIAVPVNAGKPNYILDIIFSETDKAKEVDVFVSLFDESGDPLQDATVEVNIDREESYQINLEQGIDRRLHEQTILIEGVLMTNNRGIAIGKMIIHSSELSGMVLVIKADALGESKALNYRIS